MKRALRVLALSSVLLAATFNYGMQNGECGLKAGFLTPHSAIANPQSEFRNPQSVEAERVALSQALLDLTNPWTVMCVAAHPDDEDGATLTVLRRKEGAHTVTLFSTYGEGGQNAVGPELYEELGAIRARETLEAAAIQGSEPYFLGLTDFGFSKSADEAFRVWGHDEALRRMVLQIRTLRPDVIITNHDTQSGHGHHQATGRLVMEAFDAAADPARFPEQLRESRISTWQAERLFVRVSSEGGTGSKSLEEAERAGALVSINPNERDPVRGSTYAEQALHALQRHATQGPWPQTVPASGSAIRRYRLVRAARSAQPLPRNAHSVIEGMPLPEALDFLPFSINTTRSLLLGHKELSREGVLDALIAARKRGLYELKTADNPRLRMMIERFDRALVVASGITLTITPRDPVLVPDTDTTFSINLSNTGSKVARVRAIAFDDGRSEIKPFPGRDRFEPHTAIDLTVNKQISREAWINTPRQEHLYDGHLFGEQFRARADVEIGGVSFPIVATTRVDVAPPVEIRSVEPSPLVLTPGTMNQSVNFSFRIINHRRTSFSGRIGSANREDLLSYSSQPFKLDFNEERVVPLQAPGYTFGRLGPQETQPQPPVPKGVLFMIWEHPRATDPVAHHTVAVVYSDARIPASLRVGYVPSSDDTLHNALAALGADAKELTPDDIRAGNLQSYDTIIIDNRGYQAHPELVASTPRLLDYVRAGGTLIVFYHKANEWNPDPEKGRPQLAPYPITLGNERVTGENAPVAFTAPQHALLNFPNKITLEDFNGWIQERGLYYPKQWDDRYSAPLASNDTGEPPLRGGLLAADYGRGHYIYTSMVWYRQLRAGVPGAYRVFANLISYGHTNRNDSTGHAR